MDAVLFFVMIGSLFGVLGFYVLGEAKGAAPESEGAGDFPSEKGRSYRVRGLRSYRSKDERPRAENSSAS